MTSTTTTTIVLAAAAALVLAAPAQAADAPGVWSVPADFGKTLPRFGEYKSGWYLRGDVGYRYHRMGGVESGAPIASHTFDDTVAITAGAGVKKGWFRTDLTIDYGPRAEFGVTTSNAAATQPQYVAKIESTTLLANGYLDLGTWAGFTPYVGAGAGVSRLRSVDFVDSTLPPGQLVGVSPKWTFSWAAMAGVSFDVTTRWTVDVGYRYLSLGHADSAHDALTGQDITFRDLSAQEIRVGLRFMLD